MSQTQLFALQGLSCMNCAKKVKNALEARPDVEKPSSIRRAMPGDRQRQRY